MKNALIHFCVALTVLTNGCVFGQTASYPWAITLKVVDSDGNPVAGADAWIAYHVPPPADTELDYGESSRQIKGLTDTNGIFSASHTDDSLFLGIHVEKTGYYPTFINYELYYPGQFNVQTVAANRDTTLNVIFKRIVKPMPMYAERVRENPPALNQHIGYDLEIGDWVAPYGKGINTDIIFTKEYSEVSPNDYSSKITVTFPKSGDGIQEFAMPDTEKGSGLRSPYEAPTDGYQPELVREISAHPGQQSKFDYDEHHNYFIRVQTVLDENGNIKSALYGKIYGDFMQFSYYLNPTPNSRNVEFDPKQNLFHDLKSTKQVTAP
jgi:hypothetical protein